MRAVLSGGPGEPKFWPSRGRRGGVGSENADDPEPPFWAHRGRETDSAPNLGCGLPAVVVQLPRLSHRFEDPFWTSKPRKRSEK